jgi:hypothetical protein
VILHIIILGSIPNFSKSPRSSIGWAELWRCLGYKFESYLGHNKFLIYYIKIIKKINILIFNIIFYNTIVIILIYSVIKKMDMLELVVRSRLGRDGLYRTSSSLVVHNGGYSSIGRTAECGTVGSLFDSGYPPIIKFFILARIVQLVRTLISCIKNENSNFSPG